MRIFLKIIFFSLLLFSAIPSHGQIRFYVQYDGIPMFTGGNGGVWDFNVLSGIKISPDKEIVVGLGLFGKFVPRKLNGDLKFNKSTFSLGFNYYFNRKFYLNFNITDNVLKDIITAPTASYEDLRNTFLVDYQVNINYIIFRRLHFSFGTGVIDFTKLIKKTAQNVIAGNFVKSKVALSLKLYVFQIKL